VSVDFGVHFSCSSVQTGDWHLLYREALEQAVLAERIGFSHAVVAEHHFMEDGWIPSPMLLCAAIAAVTERVQVGPDITVLPFTHPIRIAEDIAVLDNLSSGRAILGVGLGARSEEFDRFGIPFSQRVGRSEESMQVVAALLEGQRVSFHGRYLDLDDVSISPRSLRRPRPPLWYGAISEAGAVRAARYADALIVGPTPTLELAALMSVAYRHALAEQGQDPASGKVILRREAFVSADDGEAWRIGGEAIKYQYSRVYDNLPADISPEDFRAYAENRFLIGSPTQIAEQLQEYVRALATDLIIFRLQLPGVSGELVYESTRLMGEEVHPILSQITQPAAN
jgi:alkanesulfonate monooxygenase SsuD/methylene tetrahydromethanopterin reductase-like flavin-dependent oxidoreductase (luciferase family)